MIVNCLTCSREFIARSDKVKKGQSKYCSTKCRWNDLSVTLNYSKKSPIIGTTRKCLKCNLFKELEEFGPRKDTKSGKMAVCRKCNLNVERKYRSKNQEQIKKRMYNYNRERRDLVLNHYGSKCDCCGETRREFLAIDHVNGYRGGYKNGHRKEGFTQLITKIIKTNFPKDFRILCHNCNTSLGVYKYCPHQKKEI